MKRYEAYKDSGIEWIGEIPNDWSLIRFLFLFKFLRGLPITKEDLCDNGIPCISYGEIHSKYGFAFDPDINPLKSVHIKYLESTPSSLLKYGDFVFADTSEDIEGSGNFSYLNSSKRVFAGYHTIIAHTDVTNLCIRFVAYYFDSMAFRAQIQSQVSGTKVYSITQTILKRTQVLLPPIVVQESIASYLDKKTSAIDELIADKSRMLELLHEKRQAIISEAVTKGLDRTVPMKDSGIEWIGEAPEYWGILKIKHLSFMQSGHIISANDINEDAEYPVYGGNGLRGFTSSFTNKGKHILIGRQGALCGNVRLVDGMFWASEHAIVTYCKQATNVDWYRYLLETMNLNQYSTSAAQPGLSVEQIQNLFTCCPPFEEQENIATYLDRETSTIDTTIANIESQIEKLKEYRQSLISEVVTGKVKVCEEAS